jgi:hypothetical protein
MARADRIERADAWPTGGCLRFFREYEFVGSFKLATVALGNVCIEIRRCEPVV